MQNLYKGYVKTKNKKCTEKFKGGKNLHSLEEVQDLDEYAGILADDIVLIDIDDEEQSEILMQIVEDRQIDCVVYKTTRGRHFLFKNTSVKKCATHKQLACGIKFAGKERFVEWDCEQVQELPFWLLPVNSKTNFFDMEEGEGRNSALYSYILTLTGAGFSKEESRECLGLINKYVLKDALSDDELETLSRDDAFPDEVFYDGKKFLHDSFAKFMLNNEKICRINGQLYIYDNGQYVSGYRHIEERMLKHIPTLKAAQRVEVLKYIELVAPDEKEADARYIAFNNGIYDLAEGILKPYTGDLIVTNKTMKASVICWKNPSDMRSIDATNCRKLSFLQATGRMVNPFFWTCSKIFWEKKIVRRWTWQNWTKDFQLQQWRANLPTLAMIYQTISSKERRSAFSKKLFLVMRLKPKSKDKTRFSLNRIRKCTFPQTPCHAQNRRDLERFYVEW